MVSDKCIWEIGGKEYTFFTVPDECSHINVCFVSCWLNGKPIQGVAVPSQTRGAWIVVKEGSAEWWGAVERYQESVNE